MDVPAPTRQRPPSPHSSVTLLLATQTPGQGESLRKLIARTRQVQGSARGVERVRVHMKPHSRQMDRGKSCCTHGGPGYRRPGRPKYLFAEFHKDCNLHRSLWTPLDDRLYVEIKAWDADWAVHAVHAIILILGSHRVEIEQVWVVIRSGVLAWLQNKPHSSIPCALLKCATLLNPKSLSSGASLFSLLGLPCASALALLEIPCDLSGGAGSLAPNWWQGIRRTGAALQSTSDLLYVQRCSQYAFGCCEDALITLRWKYQRQSVVEFVEQEFGVVVMVHGNGMCRGRPGVTNEDMVTDDEFQMCVVGTSSDSVRQACFFMCAPGDLRLHVNWLEQLQHHREHQTGTIAFSLHGLQDFVIQRVHDLVVPSFIHCMLLDAAGIRLLNAMSATVIWCATEWSGRDNKIVEVSTIPLQDVHVSLTFLREHCLHLEALGGMDVEEMLPAISSAVKGYGKGGGHSRQRAIKRLVYYSRLDAIASHDVAIMCSHARNVDEARDVTLSLQILGKPESVKQLCLCFQMWQSAQEVLGTREAQRSAMQTELEELEQRLRRREAEHDQMRNDFETERATITERCRALELQVSTAGRPADEMLRMQSELERWRQQSVDLRQTFSRPHLVELVQNALMHLVPPDHYGDCVRMRRVRVQSVEEVANVQLWKQYTLKRQQIVESLRRRRTCPWACRVAPRTAELRELFSYIQVEPEANEVLLLHGTTAEKAAHIVRQGFDERLTHRALYGRGVYFTTDACKALQYVGSGADACIIVARVLLGHPFLATGPMPNCDRPPDVEPHGFPHDSIVAQPGICNGKGKGRNTQVHWEFVVPRGDSQIYPELLARISF